MDSDDSAFALVDQTVVRERLKTWILQQMKKRQAEFCEAKTFSLFCGTWNVNNKVFPNGARDDLKDWLLPTGAARATDIFAIGFQEIVDLTTMNVVFTGSKSDERTAYWTKKISDLFASQGLNYVLVAERHHVGNLLVVFAKAELFPFIHGIRSAITPVGVLGIMGNKGAVVIRMRVHNISVCFLCVHLSAERGNVSGRNADFRAIIDRTSLLVDSATLSSSEKRSKSPSSDSATTADDAGGSDDNASGKHAAPHKSHLWAKDEDTPLSIDNHDLIVWVGDLNYRIDESVPTVDVFSIIERGDWKLLRGKDQLCAEIIAGNVFEYYEEGPLDFKPTYKYIPGTNDYDKRTNKKLRAPAWCDRILFKCRDALPDSVRQILYDRAELLISDHRPVSAVFNIDSGVTDAAKERLVYLDLLSQTDKWVNESAPKLAVDDRVFDFGMMELQRRRSTVMTIKNVGRVLAQWKFVGKENERAICKPWFSLYPTEGVLAPGEETKITVSLCIRPLHIELMRLANVQPERSSDGNVIPIEDIVVIHVTGGSDFFCVFSCKLILEDEDAEEEEGFKDSMKIPSKKGLGSGSGSGSGASEFTTSAVTPSENTSSEDAVGGDCDEGGDEEEEEGFKDSCKGISDLEISSSSSKVKFADMSNNRQGDKDGNGENNDEEDEEEEGFKDSCKAPVDPSKTTAAWKVLSDDSGDGDLDCHHQQQQQQRDDKDSPEDDNSSSDRDSEEGFKDSCKDPTSSSLSLSADNNKNTSNIQSDLTHGSKDGCGGGNKDGDDKEEEEDEEGFKDSCKARSEEAASTSTTDSD